MAAFDYRKISPVWVVIAGIILIFIVLFIPDNLSKNESVEQFTWKADSLPNMRIENEDKLDVPFEIVDKVWNYMVKKYVNNSEFLNSLDSSLTAYWNDELFVDVYYDTPNLIMLNKKSGIRLRTRYNLTDSLNRKHGRKLLQVKLNNIDDNVMNRGEIKFAIEPSVKIQSNDDYHPVISLIKDTDRYKFKELMAYIKVNPYLLREILTNTQRRRSLYIPRNNQQFISIRLDECSSDMLFFKWKHIELEPELNEIPYTEADSAGKAFMESINQAIINDILNEFPEIKSDLTPKYNKAFNYFEKKIPFLRFLIKSGII